VSRAPVVQAGTAGSGGYTYRGKSPAPTPVSPSPAGTPAKPSPTPGPTRQPTKEELKKAAAKVNQVAAVEDKISKALGFSPEDLRYVQQELLAYARVFLPSWAQPFVVSMINAMHSVEALEMRVITFFEGLSINPPEGLMDLLGRLKHSFRPIEQPVVQVEAAPQVKTFVAPGTGGDYQPSTGVTFRSLGRGRPIVGVV